MLTVKELDTQWQALRFAVDMLDLAWSYESEHYTGDLKYIKRGEMLTHRGELLALQDQIRQQKLDAEK